MYGSDKLYSFATNEYRKQLISEYESTISRLIDSGKINSSNIIIFALTILNSIALFFEIRYFMLDIITSDIALNFDIVLQYILVPILQVAMNIVLWLPKQRLTAQQKKELKRQKLEKELKQLK